jgi:hypothetical protein
LLKNEGLPEPADITDPQLTGERELSKSPSHQPSTLLFAPHPTSAVNRNHIVNHVARAPTTNTNAVLVSEHDPKVSAAEQSFVNPYAEINNRARVKSVRSPRSSISVPASRMSSDVSSVGDAMDQKVNRIANSKHLRVASNTPEDASHSKRRWGGFLLGSMIAVFATGLGLKTRKRMTDKEQDNQNGAPDATMHFPIAAEVNMVQENATEVKMVQENEFLPNEAFSTRVFYADTKQRLTSLQTSAIPEPTISDAVSMEHACDSFSAEQEYKPVSALHDRREVADAKRQWMKMQRKIRRAKRHKRLQHLLSMRRMRLQKLRADRLQMKRKVQTDFGISSDPGLEQRIPQEKIENTTPMQVEGRDARIARTLEMRLLRLAMRAWRARGRTRTT